MNLVDTHVHTIDLSRLSYPWLDGFAALRRDHSIALYEQEARRVGIDAALHMEVDVAEGDIERETALVEEYMARPDSLIRGAISSCRPENADFPAFLDRQLARPSVKGFRRALHVVPDDVSAAPVFRANIARLAGTGLPFDLVVLARQIKLATALADATPQVQFVLDHCGVPDIKGGAFAPWAADLAEIARRPNVAVKISGLSVYGDPDRWTLADLRPYVEHAIGVFGWDRVVWGGDWPVVTLGSSLSTWVAASRSLVDGASAAEREALFSGNARRLWRL